jgi:hypothetical protein
MLQELLVHPLQLLLPVIARPPLAALNKEMHRLTFSL